MSGLSYCMSIGGRAHGHWGLMIVRVAGAREEVVADLVGACTGALSSPDDVSLARPKGRSYCGTPILKRVLPNLGRGSPRRWKKT